MPRTTPTSLRRPGCAKRAKRCRSSRGQASAEMAIGLVAIMVCIVGLLQIGALGFSSVRTAQEARTNADNLMQQGSPAATAGTDIGGWSTGGDGLRFTSDDTASIGVNNMDAFNDPLANGSMSLGLINEANYNVANSMTSTMSTDSLAVSAQLNIGTASHSIPIDPVLRSLLGAKDSSIHLQDTAAMPTLEIDGWQTKYGN